MTDLERSHGNMMMWGMDSDPTPGPDDYPTCPECQEQTHIDWMVHYAKDQNALMCQWCYKTTTHTYHCEGCGEDFDFIGVPARCAKCGGFDILHEWAWSDVQSLIREEQKKFLELAQDMPIITPGMISSQTLKRLTPHPAPGKESGQTQTS